MIPKLQKQLQQLQHCKLDPYLKVLECITAYEFECITEMLELRDCGFRNPDIMLMLGEEKFSLVCDCEQRMQARYDELFKIEQGRQANMKRRR